MIVHYDFSISLLFFAFLPVLVQPFILSTPKSKFGPLWASDSDLFEINILSYLACWAPTGVHTQPSSFLISFK
jgi:hypothetical protein